jgi:hypothetical protein
VKFETKISYKFSDVLYMNYCLYTKNYIHGNDQTIITHNIVSVIHKNNNNNKERNRSIVLQMYETEKEPL